MQIIILFTSIILLIFTSPVYAKSCYDTEKPPIPASLKFREIIIKEDKIKLKIPDNYRIIKWNKNKYNVVDPSGFEFIQCFLRNPEPTELDPRGVEIEVITSLEVFYGLLKESDVKIFQDKIKEYKALIWKSQRMYNIGYIAIQSPDTSKYIVFSTLLDENDKTPLEALITLVTHTLEFLP
jgi:hypothetical protein